VRDADLQMQIMMKDADSVPVPVHSTVVGGKSAVTVALQLLKRNRNIRWLPRNRRMPASVMFSCLSLEVAESGRTIGQNLRVIAEHILDRLLQAKSLGELLYVENPVCQGDIFTDRWPVDQTDQDLFIGDMRLLLRQLAELFDDRRSFKDRSKTLEDMFGETVARQVVDEFAAEMGQSVRSGSHFLGAAGGIVAAPSIASAKPAAPRNTFYGTKWPKS